MSFAADDFLSIGRRMGELQGSLGPIRAFATSESREQILLEAVLGARSFKAFFRMAWRSIDPAYLLWNWHIDLLCEEMERVARREITEAVFCIPPRSLKSQIMSVAFPAWVWTWFPAAKFLCGANELTLATRDAVKCRRLVKSDWYQRRWGPASPYVAVTVLSDGKRHPGVAIVGDQDNKTYYETTAGGHRFCCTPGSNVTGHGGDVVMCDDPHPTQRAESEAQRLEVLTWWNEAIPTRLNEPDRGVKMVIQQRVHRKDLAGVCIDKGYYTVVLPMEFEPDHPQRHPKDPRTQPGELLHPERISATALASLKRALNSYGVAGQLQQRPTDREGGMFKRHWFAGKYVKAVPAECIRNTVRRWDLASTKVEPGKDPDWTAGVRISKDDLGRFYIENVVRFRDTPAVVDTVIKGTMQRDGTQPRTMVSQDPGQAGVAQAQALARFVAPRQIGFVKETGEKSTRARGLASQAEVGNVYLVEGDWNEAFLDELCTFPMGGHDDQVDAAAGAFSDLFGGKDGYLGWLRQQVENAQ